MFLVCFYTELRKKQITSLFQIPKNLKYKRRHIQCLCFFGQTYEPTIGLHLILRLWWLFLHSWLVALCDCLILGLHRCGRWSEGWVSSSWGNSSPGQLHLLPCPSLPFPVVLSEHPVQSNPGRGPSAPLFPLAAGSPSLIFSDVTVRREWPA